MTKKTPNENTFGDEINLEESFDFDEGAAASDEDSENTSKKMPPPLPGMRTGRSKTIPMVIGGVVGALVLWQGGAWLFGGKSDVEKEAATLAQNLPAEVKTEIKAIKAEVKEEVKEETKKAENEADNFLKEIRALQKQPSMISEEQTKLAMADTGETTATDASAVDAADATPPAASNPPANQAPTSDASSNMNRDIFDRTMPTATPPAATTPAPAAAPAAAPAPAPTINLQPILDKLEEQSAEIDKRMSNLEQQVLQFNDRLQHMQDDMGQVNQDMMKVSQHVRGLTGDVKRLSEPLSDQHKTDLAKTEMFASPQFSVHAIIPGRAWLKNQAGATITITEGDSLDQYGKVLAIDAPNGAVVTSSGVVIR